MRKTKPLKAILVVIVCLYAVPVWAIEPVVLNQQPVEISMPWNYQLDATQHAWFAYYGAKENMLFVRRPDGSEVVLGATDRSRAQSGLEMAVANDNVSVLWRDKLPHKTTYLLPGLGVGAPPQQLEVSGSESEALPRAKLERRDGITYMLWLGERGDEKEGQRYHLYFRTLGADGKTLSPVERVLPGFYPAWIVDRDRIPVFSWAKVEGRSSILMRVFDRVKNTFGPQVRISDAPPLSPYFQAFESAGRWLVLWVGHHGDNATQWLEGMYSDDQGQNWKFFDIESLRGLDFSHLEVTTDGKGHIFLAISGIHEPKGKNDVYILRSSDNGTTWAAPYQPRPEGLHGKIQGFDPSIAFGAKPGTVMLIWEDWRNLRPNVYARFSNDYGVTWDEAAPLDTSPAARLQLDFRNQTAFAVGDRYQVIAKRAPDDNFKGADLVRYEFKPSTLQQPTNTDAGQSAPEKRTEARLRQQVETYWKALETKDNPTSYALQDPFYRKHVTYEGYTKNRGTIKYETHEIVGAAIEGNIAKVKMKFDATVPEFQWKGKPYSKPRNTIQQTETWLFIDGDWCREFYDEANDVRYAKY